MFHPERDLAQRALPWTSTNPSTLESCNRKGKPTTKQKLRAKPTHTHDLPPQKKNRFQLFRSKLAKIFSTKLQDSENVKLTDLVPMINEGLTTGELFGSAEAVEALRSMGQSEEVMLDDDGVVWKI